MCRQLCKVTIKRMSEIRKMKMDENEDYSLLLIIFMNTILEKKRSFKKREAIEFTV